ncbi:sigma 54-interacting transcriptional regulator [Desulfogranum mediterraneum]|uniref:sigma 54-interacting transcriptional regulator n=1 Tax=Desulfogranum mediterraneum TaxID=160661 RepID=UPI00041FE57F|nr:sigma 54-interacting transcriptional regulator [Desulfogranum mediterraneum]
MISDAQILIVDDEESIRLTFERFLTRAGYSRVVAVSSLQAALEAFKHGDFDLVISDIVLGRDRGTELLRKMREGGMDCPVVMITGYPNLESASEAVRLGAFDYIPKPVKKEALLHFTRQALQHRALQQEKDRLQEENEQFRRYLEAIFRSVQDAIITVDSQLQIVQLNDTAKELIRQEGGEVALHRGRQSHPGTIIKACLEDARLVLNSRKEVREHRFEYSKDDGSTAVLSLNAAPLEDTAGEFHGVVLVARDITLTQPSREPNQRIHFHGFIGNSTAMQEVYRLIENVGKTDATVLITGESGTGKELTAEAVHRESTRRDRQLIKVDCASIAEDLLESELFGHVKGSFTGAHKHRSGLIMQADGGTLFLDEIGDISPRMQLRLLRFLQEKTFYPVGQDSPMKVDVRIITATNADLKQKVTDGAFREDLYYRLRVVELSLPPLRARREEIPLLVTHFLQRHQQMPGRHITGISDQAAEALAHYTWPGNVRELEHVIERACVLCNGETIALKHLPEEICNWDHGPEDPPPASSPLETLAAGIKKAQQAESSAAIFEALQRAKGNKAEAARILGINRTTLYRRMQRLAMNRQPPPNRAGNHNRQGS